MRQLMRIFRKRTIDVDQVFAEIRAKQAARPYVHLGPNADIIDRLENAGQLTISGVHQLHADAVSEIRRLRAIVGES